MANYLRWQLVRTIATGACSPNAEVSMALNAALADPDWRVRMTAVLAVGRLQLAALAERARAAEAPDRDAGLRDEDRRALLALREVASERARPGGERRRYTRTRRQRNGAPPSSRRPRLPESARRTLRFVYCARWRRRRRSERARTCRHYGGAGLVVGTMAGDTGAASVSPVATTGSATTPGVTLHLIRV